MSMKSRVQTCSFFFQESALFARARRAVLGSLAVALGLLLIGTASAQGYPERPVKIIYPYATGGTGDVLSRYIALKMSEVLGQQFIVDNRTGAGGGIGHGAVASAAPDGYTVLITTSTAVAQTPYLLKDSGFDPLKSLEPIGRIGATPLVLMANSSVPANDFSSFIEWAKSRPQGVDIATAGPTLEMALAVISQRLKVGLVNVPYRGQAPALQAAVANEVPVFFNTPSAISNEHLKSGKLRVLGITSAKPTPVVPDGKPIDHLVPGGFSVDIPFGMWVPAQTPRDVKEKLAKALAAVMAAPDVEGRLLSWSLEKQYGTPEELTAVLQRDINFVKSVLASTTVKFGN